MEPRRARSPEARAGRDPDQAPEAAVRARRPAAFRTRANGIPANRCRAGRSAAGGGATACRSGKTTRSSPTRRSTTGTARRRRGASSWSSPTCSGVGPQHAIPAYEDVWHYLWRERRLPVNVDPLKSELKDEAERARLSRIFEQGLGQVVGYVLPLQRVHEPDPAARWASGAWFLRSGHLFLIPGDSPIGYRLPLDSLPWVAPERASPVLRGGSVCGDAAIAAAAAVPARPRGSRRGREARSRRRRCRQPGESAAGIVRTALCVEPRHGRLHVFMPPVGSTEDYLDLVAAIEADRVDAEDARGHRRRRRRRRTAGSTTSGSRRTPG